MKRVLFKTLLLAWLGLILAPLAVAKGSPDKIIIMGPQLTEPFEITDPEILKGFDPWNGQFLDRTQDTIREGQHNDQPYDVFFYLKDKDGQFRMFYAFQYTPAPSDGQGYIYLPQEGEEWHLMNGQTILRASGWHYASAEWDTLMRRVLTTEGLSRTTSRAGIPSDQITSSVWITVLVFISLVSVAAVRIFRRD
jgi:hypothetical protein